MDKQYELEEKTYRAIGRFIVSAVLTAPSSTRCELADSDL